MTGYSKLFGTMWEGSLYGRFEASAVFMVFLSLCDAHGIVDMTPEAIAGRCGWPLKFIKAGIAELEKPDGRSRTPDEEGRRIILLDAHRDWGWRITNYARYREHMRSLERREYLREKQRESRVNKRQQVSTCQPLSTDSRGRSIGIEQNVETLSPSDSPIRQSSSLYSVEQDRLIKNGEVGSATGHSMADVGARIAGLAAKKRMPRD